LKYYLHTIGDQPAYFSEHDGQIVYASTGRFGDGATLAQSLRQIRLEQQTTIRNRLSWGFKDNPGKYDYVRVVTP
jgi:hypothetical protein